MDHKSLIKKNLFRNNFKILIEAVNAIQPSIDPKDIINYEV